jgi:Predicted transcriptional regulators
MAGPLHAPAGRKRMIRLLVEDVTLDKTDVIHLHVRFKGGQLRSSTIPIPSPSWQLYQTDAATLALLDKLLDEHTDGEVAAALNAAGHRTGHGRPFTSTVVLDLRRNHGFPSRHQRLRSAGKLSVEEMASALDVSSSTIKAWHRAGLLPGHKADDRNIRMFDPPAPGAPRLVKHQGSNLARRVPVRQVQGGAV